MRNNDPSDVLVEYSDFFLNGGGFLNAWKWSDIMGLMGFRGLKLHSANWDDSVDLKAELCVFSGDIVTVSRGSEIVPQVLQRY
jgi:hypothetical protein